MAKRNPMSTFAVRLGLVCLSLSARTITLAESPRPDSSADNQPREKYVATDEYLPQQLEGWTVRVNRRLLNEDKELGQRALKLLELKLFEIKLLVPPKACEQLQKVPIWLGVNDGHAPCAEYHPNRAWLKDNGYNPDKAKGVEIGCAAKFLDWVKQQPMMILHELSHAYHDQVLSFDHADVRQAFDRAKDSRRYESILRVNNRRERAYAITNPQEYFAECSEAFFGQNDFYPFVRAELKQHDPEMFDLLAKLWNE